MIWLSSRWRIAVMVLPAVVLFTLFFAYPVLYGVGYSLTDAQGFSAPRLVGLDNYAALGDDPFFWLSLKNTVIILVVSVAFLVPASFALALLMQQRIRAAGALRALLFGPAIVAPILVGLVWVFILDPRVGLLNRLLVPLGIPEIQWIGGDSLTPYSIALVFSWASIGFAMTIFYAGLQQLPDDVMEASSLDGATRWQQLLHVTVPMMRETIGIVSILLVTNVFKIFELVYMLTGGGPVHRSETLVSYMYFVTFTSQRYGAGMAIAVVVLVLGALTSLVYLALARRGRSA
ncbi:MULTISPECIES: carbohydrate ABC transporter permease [unclassified Isoptericola]|uniref:carbohydrate ABC transporter permease n=1 Tax=unclassified Isoptericola TaxID=2623355 RepID=UPI002712BFD9|nr:MULTISPECIES: sugar ABC transporter permease [unclassified Isoptericola]MDO8143801.1 sugar ABC transporter permease [Isoptericola sp. 178]MDO8147696.1 sugar ABC transporter permease [Isoptericola sp. b515]MDO8150000.1 sugar ABC transporter permease [Isoptericola sp. b408]